MPKKPLAYKDIFAKIAEAYEFGYKEGVGERETYYKRGFDAGVEVGDWTKKRVWKQRGREYS